MTHSRQQSKLSSRRDHKYTTKTICNVNPHYEERPRRALLLSSEDVERMAVESSRAKLMMQLVSKPEETSREFGSYFRGLKNESDPVYVMTSHTSTIPIPKRVVPTYPSMVQAIRWSPNVEQATIAYSEDSQTDTTEEEVNFRCRCRRCKMKNCLGKGNSDDIPKCLKDNIVKFSDNTTMTPILEDIGCGSRTLLSRTPATSEVSIATSESVAVECRFRTYRAAPIPILKKPRTTVKLQKAVRDFDETKDTKNLTECCKETDHAPICPNNSENTSECECGRKIIYNEGISDLLKTAQSRRSTPTRSPTRIRSPTKLKKSISKASVTTRGVVREVTIPYAHREHSRYHYDCKHSITKLYRCEIDEHDIQRIDRRKDYRSLAGEAMRCSRIPSIRLPKKVLTSERDIEAFVDKRRRTEVRTRFM